MKRLKEKTAVVTGAGSGIGACIARSFAKEGAIVLINDIDEKKALKVLDEIEAEQGSGRVFPGDVSERKSVREMFKAIRAAYDKIDILVNNAGVAIHRSLKAHADEEWDRVIQVNLKSVFLCCREVLHGMKRNRTGRIINISSMIGITGAQFLTSYAASKGGINALTKSLAREVGEFGITVNAICPGLIDTDMSSSYLSAASKGYAEATKALWSFRPLKQSLRPQDVANTAVFLASEESNFISGQLIQLDGGLY